MLTFNWCILNHRPSHPLNARNSLQQDYPLIYKILWTINSAQFESINRENKHVYNYTSVFLDIIEICNLLSTCIR